MDMLFPLAVRVKGEDANKGWWVMAFDGGRFLISAEDGIGFRWVDMADCEFTRAINPETAVAATGQAIAQALVEMLRAEATKTIHTPPLALRPSQLRPDGRGH